MRIGAWCVVIAACGSSANHPSGVTGGSAALIHAEWIDRSASPCEDFYKFACGGWTKHAVIPPGATTTSSLDDYVAENQKMVRALVADARDPRIASFDKACMAAGDPGGDPGASDALAGELRAIEAATDRSSTARAIARVQLLAGTIGPWTTGTGAMFGLGTDYDFHEGGLVRLQLDQGGLPGGDPTLYTATDDATTARRATYRAHVAKMLELSGITPSRAAHGADISLEYETTLARAHVAEEVRRAPEQTDHLLDRAALARLVPHLDWDAYFAALGRPQVAQVNVLTPAFYTAVDGVLARLQPSDLQLVLRWQLLQSLGRALPRGYQAEVSAYTAAATGAQGDAPRADYCTGEITTLLGDALAAGFLEHHFPLASRQAAEALATQIFHEMEASLARADWLDEPTRTAGLAKLHRMHPKLGGPTQPATLAGLEISAQGHLANHLHAAAFQAAHFLARVDTHAAADEWLTSPQTITAFFDVSTNAMVVPAAIFQPPFFTAGDPSGLDAGRAGWVIGHELSHGFDAQGRKYDTTGALHDWWSPAVAAEYERRASCVADQYSAYEPMPGVHLDGKRELTENIADVGATRLAFLAYQHARAGKPPLSEAGFDSDQLFFLALGQWNCELTTPEATRAAIATDVHPPGHWRLDGPLADLPAFAEAFHCPAGTPMAPVKRCTVW